MSYTYFEPEGSSSGRRLYVQLWYGTVRCVLHIVLRTRLLVLVHVQSTVPQISRCLPENEPSGSKHVEDTKI